MIRIIRFVVIDLLRNRFILAYTILLAIFSLSAFGLEDNSSKGILTLLNLILLTVPLASILFTTTYLYNSSEFIELLVSQPIRRSRIWISLFGGLAFAFSAAFVLGAGIPLFLFAEPALALMMTATGMLVSLVFVSLAFLSAIISRDKARGIGVAITIWLYFALLFDGLVLFLIFQLSDYPIEKLMVVMAGTSPIDLARILILLHLDVSAMMGYTGAVFREFFGTAAGLALSFGLLFMWVALPFLYSLRRFLRRDL
jgi:Cu-processing system permease protein